MKAPAVAPEMSVMQQATPENVLMAAAEMHRMGKFSEPDPQTKSPPAQPNPHLGRRPKKLGKVVK